MTGEAVVIKSRLFLAPFEAWIALVAVYAGLGHWFLAASGPAVAVEAAFPGLAVLWSLFYAAGGVAVLAGLWRRSPRVEAFGLCLLAAGAGVSFLAFTVAGAPVLPTLIGQGGILLASALRIAVLKALP